VERALPSGGSVRIGPSVTLEAPPAPFVVGLLVGENLDLARPVGRPRQFDRTWPERDAARAMSQERDDASHKGGESC
jgi:hypothetical protein